MANPERVNARAAFFDDARELTPLLAVKAAGAEFLVPTADRSIGRKLFTKEKRPEMRMLQRAVEIVGAHGTFVDVGANIGTAVITALGMGFKRGVAIEPGPDNARLLRANLALNGLQDRCRVVEAAATKHDRIRPFAASQAHGRRPSRSRGRDRG